MPVVITLLTDFGLSDPYVGIVKGVILTINPDARIVDLTHDVTPQNVEEAAYLLSTACRHFPDGTVHVAVVDPGVGTGRRAIAARIGRWTFVAPDNGLLTRVIRTERGFEVFQISEARYMLAKVGATFHARDVFAPAAAHLSLGVPLSRLGPPVSSPLLLPDPPRPTVAAYEGKVIHIDRFGNCITDIEEDRFRAWASGAVTIEAEGRPLQGPARTYADAAPGEPVALFGSSGHLEIAVAMGSAASALGLALGSRVSARRAGG